MIRGALSAAALGGALCVAAASAGEPPLRVGPVVRAEQTDPRRPRDAPAAVDPRFRALAEMRERQWRSFPDHLSRAGVDWSRGATRRRGWSPRPARAVGRGGITGAEAAGGLPPDVIRVAMIRIDFKADRTGNQSTGNGRFDLSGPDTLQPPIDRPPRNRPFWQAHGEALRRYYDAQSYGRTVIQPDVWPSDRNGAYSLSDMADYGPWRFSQDNDVFEAAKRLFHGMVAAADTQSVQRGDPIPWDSYDRIIFIHAGSDLQSDVRQDSPRDIPSFTIGVSDSEAVLPSNATRPIDRCAIFPETINQDGLFGTVNGVIAHECGHLFFGLYDLYDIFSGLPIVGYWSLMDSGNLVGSIVGLSDGTELFATGLIPPSVDPWQRLFVGDGLVPQRIAFGDTIPILDSERNPDLRFVPLSSDEYLLLENRHLSPADSVAIDQDDTTRVVLGPMKPDGYEYDALLPGSGILAWHIDESVIPNEFVFPCDTARANPDCGLNTNFSRLAISIVEADGLADLGDLSSPYLLGAPFDPYFKSNNPSLSDSTAPPLRPHIGTRPHMRLDFLDDPAPSMRVAAFRTWQLKGWPVAGDFPPGGPQLLAVDADGNRDLEVCWAGGDQASADSAALFAVRIDGQGIVGPDLAFCRALDRRPRPLMAALPTGGTGVGGILDGPSLFAVSTFPDGLAPSDPGGDVWVVDHLGVPRIGWPATLPSIVTTPPVFAGAYPNATVYVGCADGRVYGLGLDGAIVMTSAVTLNGPVSGRLAVSSAAPSGPVRIAAGSAAGEIGVFAADGTAMPGWPRSTSVAGFMPDFLWMDFGTGATDCAASTPVLVAHHADWLWAFCAGGASIPGWGRDVGDTLVAGLGAGDPDGDGYPELLTQSVTSGVTFWNATGHPSPGWPRRATREGFRSGSPPLAADWDGDGLPEVTAMNASGIVAALRANGTMPEGFPLATGLGATGAALVASLDRDATLELIAPDERGVLYGYSVPTTGVPPLALAWPMVGGDAGRTCELTIERTPTAPATSVGPLVAGSLKAYPNPARRRPVSFAYRLTEPAAVEFRIIDGSGHEVASFTRTGRPSDNLEVWDPGSLPAGLYVARIRFKGIGERTERVPIGVIR